MKNVVVFASGSGTNFQALIDAQSSEICNYQISGLIASKHGIKSLERATKNQIPSAIIAKTDFASESEFSNRLLDKLADFKADYIVLAGYLSKIPRAVIQQFENCIINIHPSLLPKYGGKGFYGLNVHKAVIKNSESESGCTVHFVTEEYDEGDIVQQRRVSVFPDDTPELLQQRVLSVEHSCLVSSLIQIIESRES